MEEMKRQEYILSSSIVVLEEQQDSSMSMMSWCNTSSILFFLVCCTYRQTSTSLPRVQVRFLLYHHNQCGGSMLPLAPTEARLGYCDQIGPGHHRHCLFQNDVSME